MVLSTCYLNLQCLSTVAVDTKCLHTHYFSNAKDVDAKDLYGCIYRRNLIDLSAFVHNSSFSVERVARSPKQEFKASFAAAFTFLYNYRRCCTNMEIPKHSTDPQNPGIKL